MTKAKRGNSECECEKQTRTCEELTAHRTLKGEGGELHLFTHADLHYGVADQRFPQIFVFLLLEPLDVFPGRPHKLPGGTTVDADLQVNET